MTDYNNIELKLYHDCLFEIKKRIDVIAEYLNGERKEYQIVRVEIICLQFRKILEKIALMSLVANKEAYAENNEKFAKHYHAERIIRDLERINPNFYPVPIERTLIKDDLYDLKEITDGFLTKDEFVKVYEKCGAMMHAHNPFSDMRQLNYYEKNFHEWLTKIHNLVSHHKIQLIGGKAMVVGILIRSDNGLPQALIFEQIDND